MKILGIHDGHGASAALIEDGQLKAAVQEERLSRLKNQGGFPELAVNEVLDIGGCELGDVNCFVFSGVGMLKWNRKIDHKKMFFGGAKPEKILTDERISWLTDKGVNKKNILFIDHHLCHAGTAFYGQSDREGKKLVLTCDGWGDLLCGSVNIAEMGKIKRIAEIEAGDSAAIIYSMVTLLMGFRPFEEEFKVMGIGPYGYDSSESNKIAEQLLKLFEYDSKLGWRKSVSWPNDLKRYLEDVVVYHRFDNVAAGVQKFIERFFVGWVKNCIQETGVGDVCLAGGLFMNVKLNKAIMELDELKSLYVFPSCGDETNSIGAGWVEAGYRGYKIESLEGFYTGRDFDVEVEKAVNNFDFSKKVKITKYNDIEKETAKLLSEGKITARFKGSGEFGARALGNRSILADASRPGVVREINAMIKMRDFWMPFAPSMLEDESYRYIENPKGIFAPYMIQAFDVKIAEADNLIGGLHEADMTCRPQVVIKEYNPCYYKLLQYYKFMSGKGVLLNTSFNLHGSPMVYGPKDALEVFDRSGLNYLAIGNFIIEGEKDGRSEKS